MIPRIKFHPKDVTLPIEMERKQFPVRLCFAVTSNKSQGQSIRHVGIHLGTQQFFSHGQVNHLKKIPGYQFIGLINLIVTAKVDVKKRSEIVWKIPDRIEITYLFLHLP